MRLNRILTLFPALAILACAGMQDMMTLSKAVNEKYHVPVAVNINNGTHLTLTFANADQSMKLDDSGRASFARDAASFAKAHYPKSGELADISVRFATVSHNGPLTVTRSEAPYTFATSELP